MAHRSQKMGKVGKLESRGVQRDWGVGRTPTHEKWPETEHVTRGAVHIQPLKCPLFPGQILMCKTKLSHCNQGFFFFYLVFFLRCLSNYEKN